MNYADEFDKMILVRVGDHSFFLMWGEKMVEKRVIDVITPIAAKESINIYKVSYLKEDGINFLRIMIEKDDLSMDLETCKMFSEKISNIIEKNDIIKEEYFLDVCSTGEQREYKNENLDFILNKSIKVQTKDSILKGKLLSFDEIKIVISEKVKKEEINILRKDISSLKLSYEM